MSRIGISSAAAVVAVALVLAGASGMPAAEPRVPAPPSCVLGDGVLTVDPKLWDVTVERDRDKIVPSHVRPVRCTGGPATVHNVDTVHLLDDEVKLDFRGGPFAPGITDEGDGSSEIEFEVEHGIGGALRLMWAAGKQRVAAASLGKELDGFNLNAGEATPDLDLVLRPQEPGFGRARVSIHLGAGADEFDASGESPFLASARNGLLVEGGNGVDKLVTGAGDDTAVGGRGRDRITTADNHDLVAAEDGRPDRIDCGRALDFVEADRDDHLRSCQRFGSASDAELEAFLDD